jgi:hypothetical protein
MPRGVPRSDLPCDRDEDRQRRPRRLRSLLRNRQRRLSSFTRRRGRPTRQAPASEAEDNDDRRR